MNNTIKKVILFSLTCCLVNCVTHQVEEFSDSFFTYKDKQEKKYFIFVLTLKKIGIPEDYISEYANNTNNKNSNKKPTARPKKSKDSNVSLKFRMEEITHARLKNELDAINYCQTVEYESEVYENYKYKIKGFCEE